MKLQRVVVLNGVAKSGKDTFVKMVESVAMRDPNHKVVVGLTSTIDPIKNVMAKEFGWTGGKTEKDRLFMHNLKMLTTEYCDLSFSHTKHKIDAFFEVWTEWGDMDGAIMFVMAREPKDIARYADHYGSRAVTALMRMPLAEASIPDNEGDQGVFDYSYDYFIENIKDLKYLQVVAENFYKILKKSLDID
jgi:hypothetical protein